MATIIGLFMEGPNTGACLLRDGELVAMVEEERFSRVKRASEAFPARSVRYCLQTAGLRLRDVEVVATAWDHGKYPDFMDRHMRAIPERSRDPHADLFEGLSHAALSEQAARFKLAIGLRAIDPEARCRVSFYPHHYCHAASVHFYSGFRESSILVVDGSGEELATTTWRGDGARLEALESWSLPNSLGWYYAAITEFLGFEAYDGEGKVMGLAPYGRPDPQIAEKLRLFCQPEAGGGYRVDPTYVYYGPRTHSRKFTDRLTDLLGPPRLPDAPLTAYHQSVAYEAQKLLEEVAVGLTLRLLERTGTEDLCLSGGVVMNCKMNGVLSNLPGVRNVFINPASHDSGAAMGAAVLAHIELGGVPAVAPLRHAAWGPEFTDAQIEAALRHCHLRHRRCANIAETTAELLAAGKIVGWFQGRAEFGARALGGRSILASPLIRDMKDVINARVKYREGFRPFAPSMIEEVRDRYLVNPKDSPFMILAYEMKDEYKELLPAVVHVDGTVRPQTVSRAVQPLYWSMLGAFGRRTGHPIVLNTSFNIKGEPIVNSPLEAIRCYFSTGMDALAIGNFLLTKEEQ